MPSINKSEFSQHQPQQIYDLVNNVKSYKEFIPWCVDSLILDGEADSWMIAKLTFDFHGIKHGFTTKNQLHPHNRIEISLVDGPFSHLAGNWQFKAQDNGCLICLELEYSFSHNWLGSIFEPAFIQVSNLLVTAFKERADEIY